MSYVTIYRIGQDGIPNAYDEARVAPAGAPVIWRELWDRYLPGDYVRECMMGNGDGHKKLWPLWKEDRLHRYERVCLLWTFDRAFVKREAFGELGHELNTFFETIKERGVNPTLPEVASVLGRLYDEEDCMGACFQQTSVSDSPWFSYKTCPACEQEIDEQEPYNFLTGNHHFEIFDSLEELRLGTNT